MAIILPNQALVLNTFAVLVDETPGNAALAEHVAFIDANGADAYKAAINGIFANSTDAELATSLLDNLGLGSVFTQEQAEAFIAANADNRVGAMIDLAGSFYNYNGSDADILAAQTDYVDAIDGSYNYSIDDSNTAGAALDGDLTAGGRTFTLTTGIDGFIGSTSNDRFVAAPDGGTNTFTALDSLDGGDGNDTFTYAAQAALTLPTGATVTNIESAVLAGTTVTANVTSWTGLTDLTVTASSTTNVTAAATTDVTEAASVAASTVTGGNNVTIVHGDFAGAVTVDKAVGTVNVTSEQGAVNIGTTTAVEGDVVVSALGATTVDGGTAIDFSAFEAVSLTSRVANVAAATATETAKTAAAAGTDAIGKAYTAAAAVVTNLQTMDTGVQLAATDTIVENNALSLAAYEAGAITRDQKIAIDAAFASGLATSAAAARAAALAVYQPIQDAADTTAATALSAKTDNIATTAAADAAADAVVIADGVIATAMAAANLTATTNSALASVTISDNYAATAKAGDVVTDASTLSNTLTSVTLKDADAVALTGKALTSVSATDGTNNVTVTNATVDHTQTFTLENIDSGTYTDNNAKTLNVVSNGSEVNKLGLSATSATAVNITGDAGLTLSSDAFAAAAVIDASAATGAITMDVEAGQTFTGGSGNDVIEAQGTEQAKAIDAAAGTDKLIVTSATALADVAGTTDVTEGYTQFSNFEALEIASGLTVDVSKFTNSAIESLIFQGAATVTNLNATQAAAITAEVTGALSIGVKDAAVVGQIDTVDLTIDDGATTTSTVTLAAPSMVGVELVNITANDNVTIGALTSMTAFTNITVDGAADVSITSGATALNVNSVVDATAVTGDVTLNFVAGTDNGISLKAGDGDNTLTGTDVAGKGNSIVAGDGDNTLTGGQADDIITVGDGTNTLGGAAGNNTITAGDGQNTVTSTTGADTITLGNGWNTVDSGAGNDTITVGTGGNYVTGGAGADTITFGAHVAGVVDGIILTAAAQTATAATNGAMVALAAAGLTGADVVTGLQAGDTIDITTAASTVTGALEDTIAEATGATASLVRGNFASTTGIFTASATGVDSLFVYDADGTGAGTVTDAVVLSGVVATGTADAGLITFA